MILLRGRLNWKATFNLKPMSRPKDFFEFALFDQVGLTSQSQVESTN